MVRESVQHYATSLAGHLTQMIKERNGYSVPDKDLTLYLAKKGDNWLTTADPDVARLENGEVPKGILDIVKHKGNKMDPKYRISNTAFNFPDEDNAGEDEIHVLVAVPGVGNKKAKIKDGDSSTGYSYLSFNDINAIMPAGQYEQPTKAIEDGTIDLLYSYLLVVTKAFGEVVTGTEAKRLHFIAPVLACVCALFDGDVQIFAEENVVGKRVHGNGKFEFVIKRGRKRICIVEAKKDDLQQGLALAYVGCEVLSDVEGLSTVYNVVTNYKEWLFSRITEETVEREEATILLAQSIPTRGSVKNIAEKIYAMLSEDD